MRVDARNKTEHERFVLWEKYHEPLLPLIHKESDAITACRFRILPA